MHFTLFLMALVVFTQSSMAHMIMSWPPSLKYSGNPFANAASIAGDSTAIDYSLTSPLSATGSDYPCKGYQSLLGTTQGSSVVTWQAGQTYNFTITGGAPHGGGSCQASISTDKGKTFTVITSFVGSCPLESGDTFKFDLPSDTPAQDSVLFAWTWFNKIGNREMYMNCAVVDITAPSASSNEKTAFSSRPQIFQANINNGCATTENVDLVFPNPGVDVVTDTTVPGPPAGNCAAAAGSSGSSSLNGTTSSTTTSSHSASSSQSATSSVVSSTVTSQSSAGAGSSTLVPVPSQSHSSSTINNSVPGAAHTSSNVAPSVSQSTTTTTSHTTLMTTSVKTTTTLPVTTVSDVVVVTSTVTDIDTVTVTVEAPMSSVSIFSIDLFPPTIFTISEHMNTSSMSKRSVHTVI
jgi:hypothetical protein